MAARHVVLAERKLMSYVYAVDFHALILARYGPMLAKVSGYDAIIKAEIIAYMEVETNAENNKVDLADFLAIAEDSPVIIIANDDDEENVEEEIEDVEVNPEEI
ncbi:hypothetical protein TIFTF001_046504 [Ficus carica]|uniref:Uncharacterized protein n=1 Tax=Ficus carica TaxID=3494 RepID=A0AA87Z715_FICCA|nr:hypothetical protein TIFTF001_046502 [Ficus carica]GMN31319.1 hypothetical protein TIFTF001_046504 [Ficus carica]